MHFEDLKPETRDGSSCPYLLRYYFRYSNNRAKQLQSPLIGAPIGYAPVIS